jgi:hypothetical protein
VGWGCRGLNDNWFVGGPLPAQVELLNTTYGTTLCAPTSIEPLPEPPRSQCWLSHCVVSYGQRVCVEKGTVPLGVDVSSAGH